MKNVFFSGLFLILVGVPLLAQDNLLVAMPDAVRGLSKEVVCVPNQNTARFFHDKKLIFWGGGLLALSGGALVAYMLRHTLLGLTEDLGGGTSGRRSEPLLEVSYQFPMTCKCEEKKEYPFSPFLTDEGDMGLPRPDKKNPGYHKGRLCYIDGLEKSGEKFHPQVPSWGFVDLSFNGNTVANQQNLPQELLNTPSVFSADGKGIARPYLFFGVMGLMEIEFARVVEKNEKRFPLLQKIKGNNGSSVFEKLPADVEKELAAFPSRQALLGSEFYLVDSNAKLTVKASIEGAVDFDTYNAENLFKKYKQSETIEEARRLAVRDTDIRYLQEMHPGAAFQIASNIDCLEGGMEKLRLEEMQYGAVQGENAALGAMGGSIIRKYCIERQERLLLDNTNKGFMGTEGFKQGYWKLDNAKILPGALALNQVYLAGDEMLEHVRVGVHKNVAVTSGYYDQVSSSYSKEVQKAAGLGDGNWFKENGVINSNRWNNKGHNYYVYNGRLGSNGKLSCVHQIFTAAYDLSNHNTAYKNLTDQEYKKNHENFAKKLLYAMYRGTIVAAANLRVKKLFLTYLGCGAFGNKSEWVREILNREDIKQLVKDSGMKVYVVSYRPPHELN